MNENATVTFYFTDIEADEGVTNNTFGVALSIVPLDASTSWWVEEISAGTYELKMNASELGSTGTFSFEATFEWILGKPFFDNRTLTFTISITGASAVLTYIPPAHVPIGDNITIIVEYRDSGTGDGISNSSGYVGITITPLNSTVYPFQYWIENTEDGVFIYTINSTVFWTTGSIFFEFNVTWAKSTLPYYTNITGTEIRSVIREINTQAIADAPNPGTVPIGDNVSIIVTYYDLDHSENVLAASIDSDWAYDWDYVALGDGRFNVTLTTLSISSPGKVSVVFTFNRTFYLTKTSTVQITIRLATSISTTTAPTPSVVPVGDYVIIEVTYFDIDHQVNITDANITTDWAYGWSWVRVPNGGFRVTLHTDTVVNMISFTVTFTINKTGYLDGSASAKFEVRLIRTGISLYYALSNLIAGENVTVTVALEDLDHGIGIEGAIIITDAPANETDWRDITGGYYEVDYDLWLKLAGTYPFEILANIDGYEPVWFNIDIDLRLAISTLETPSTLIIADWSEMVLLEALYNNTDNASVLIAGAYVVATIAGADTPLAYDSDSYKLFIDTSLLNVGTYIITLNATKTNVESRILQVSLVIRVLETTFNPADGQYSFAIYSGGLVELTVFYESQLFGAIDGATVAYTWDIGNGDVSGNLVANGTAGYYTTIVDSAGADTNIYTLYVRANKSNYAEASIYFSVDVGVVETELSPHGTSATLGVVFNESILVSVEFIETSFGDSVIGATVTFKFTDASYNGSFVEVAPGKYNVTIETMNLYAGSFTLYVYALKPGFETGALTLFLEISHVDTSVDAIDPPSEAFFGQSVTFNFTYTDTHNDVPIENATLVYQWAFGTGNCTELGNGIYQFTLDTSESIPSLQSVYITASKLNYQLNTIRVTLLVKEIETEIVVGNLYDTPIGDTLTIQIHFDSLALFLGSVGGLSKSLSSYIKYSLTLLSITTFGPYDM